MGARMRMHTHTAHTPTTTTTDVSSLVLASVPSEGPQGCLQCAAETGEKGRIEEKEHMMYVHTYICRNHTCKYIHVYVHTYCPYKPQRWALCDYIRTDEHTRTYMDILWGRKYELQSNIMVHLLEYTYVYIL